MATPDIIALRIDDPPIIPGNIVSGDFADRPYNKWFQFTNPRSGNLEWCCPIGPDRAEVRFSDLPNPDGSLDKVALRARENYTLIGVDLTIASVHTRDEANGQGNYMGQGTFLMITQRHTVMLQLSGVPTQGATITITNTAAGIEPISVTIDDKSIRAGGIQVNHIGQRPDDALKYGYLAARIPGGPDAGTVDFIKAYGFTDFHILDGAKEIVFTGPIVQRVNSAATTGEGYDKGIDVADLSQGWAITAISKAASAVVTCPGHGLAVGDKVRFLGVNGMTQLESPPATTAGSLWFAPTVTAADADTVTINVNSNGFTAFANTTVLSEALGGVNNKIYKTFNTNRAGTFVFGLDFSSWIPSADGTYHVYIPGYGISDPMQIASDAWAQAAAKLHEGIFNLRMGIAVSSASGYSRGVALTDGVNGVTNYRSTLPAMFCSEGAQSILPAGSSGLIGAGMGGYAGAGTLRLTALTCTGTTVTATTTTPHGVTVGQSFAIQMQGCVPTSYNHGNGALAISTGANTLTYTSPTGAALAAATTIGYCRTGFGTDVRHSGHVGHQDAGDNDDPAVDHFPGWKLLALVFRNIPKSSRVTPYQVPLSSTVLDPTLFAGTDNMPPLFHEMFWYGEAYRKNQEADGSVWGGHELAKFGSMIADYPEPIDKYRGTDAGGSLTGQTVHAYIFARDHLTTFLYAGYAAQLAQIAYDYGLTALGDAYKASAIAAYAWADDLVTDPVVNDAYYNGELNLKDKAGWSETTYQNAMTTLNGGYMGRAITAKVDAAGSLYRLLGGSAGGQTPYGDFIEKNICIVANVATPGTGYAVNDMITLAGGTSTVPVRILITGVDANGGVTGRTIRTMGQYSTNPTNPVAQASTTGSGTGATFTLTFAGMYSQMVSSIGAYDYSITPGANVTARNYMQGRSNNNNPAVGLNPSIGYQGMYFSTAANTSGGTKPGGVLPAIQAHMNLVALNGFSVTTATSFYLQLMQAGCSFIQGTNLPGKAFITGVGPRPYKCILHEDSFKYGTEGPHGINPYGYFSWGTSFMFFNFAGSGPACDGPLNYNTDNVTGSYETMATPGSAKMWTPWRGGSSYWEWAPENRNVIFNSEFDQTGMLNLLAMQLYLHGWDGNA